MQPKNDINNVITAVLGDQEVVLENPNATVEDALRKLGIEPLHCARLDGLLVDLSAPLPPRGEAYVIDAVSSESPEGMDVLAHSAAHITAQAVQRLYGEHGVSGQRIPQGNGPAESGSFYQDFDLDAVGLTASDIDLEEVRKEMLKIAAEDNLFVRVMLTKEEARARFAGDPLKIATLDGIPEETVSIYNMQKGYEDLCRGPHVPRSGVVRHVALTGCSSAHWLRESTSKQLTRIHGIARPSAEALEADLGRLEQARARDHRRIGVDMGLYAFSHHAPGAAFYLPRGTVLRNELLDYKREKLHAFGYDEVVTPTLMHRSLWEVSGHWEHYRANMFCVAPAEGEEASIALKPMNCPGHVLLYGLERRSHRDLPIRYAEFGVVHRNELSGALSGLLRVRTFTQDDAHLFVRNDQLEEEVAATIRMYLEFYEPFGFSKLHVGLSTRPEKRLGEDHEWDLAEGALQAALAGLDVPYEVKKGDGAFYGPKVDFGIEDCLGRVWQCGTIQVDFQLPRRFDLTFVDESGAKARPVMIHPATMGSVERFMAVLVEHFGGRFPTWLAPVQVSVLTVSEDSAAYGREVADELRAAGVRVEIDDSPKRLGKKVFEARRSNAPFVVVVGREEVDGSTISVTTRDVEGSCVTTPAALAAHVLGEQRHRTLAPAAPSIDGQEVA